MGGEQGESSVRDRTLQDFDGRMNRVVTKKFMDDPGEGEKHTHTHTHQPPPTHTHTCVHDGIGGNREGGEGGATVLVRTTCLSGRDAVVA